ncbi:biotin--[acetyl-CoA-carboxylase] ligase [Corynebacterium aquatimens]|uniref:biotin--[biotin carboxyl-carrier protein] ligase n=1 Tax=Corynebacterium aquatimens TaxID=1190508 RepID=A0A931E4V6_9CORY|nr:biotin--[acetyl-CoA-carboxylase] ligase [Corynebacterium aquatimens]MBG6123131.1 BirA family biotin operon repressor/biotin-[acetyl-CoA-carboxylase] ligase [Corynebacterium aquatimens]WJY66537.1 Bifunctional ligase/repressor BirA [Corynebacterium aquatimens]
MTVRDVQRIQTDVAQWWTQVEFVESTESTNTDLLASGTPGSVLLADEQVGGKGRKGRVWTAPKGSSLIVSVCVEASPELGIASLAAGVAVTDVIPTATLKWPNDVLLGEKKVAGILSEADFSGDAPRVVVGIGVNVAFRQEELPVDTATSLNLEGIDVDWDQFAVDLLIALGQRLNQWATEPEALLADYRAVCSTIGKNVTIDTGAGTVEGLVEAVDKHGCVVVDGTSFSAGDVTHLRPKGNGA